MDIFILTYCKKPDTLYGNLLTINSIRNGFPNANVTVYDNASDKVCRDTIRARCEASGIHFKRIEKEVRHWVFIEKTIQCYADQQTPVLFLDPDIVFWKDCSNWGFDGKFAGRLLPEFYDKYVRCQTVDRLHSSFLWLDNPRKITNAAMQVLSSRFEMKLVEPFMFYMGDKFIRYDTFAGAYHALKDHASAFTAEHLDSYDHLFCGTHLHLVEKKHSALKEIHKKVKDGDIDSMRGLWRDQEQYLNCL